jgi:hypothetical protein
LRITTRLKAMFALLALVALVAPSFAGAQSSTPTEGEYDNTLTQINTGSNPPAEPGDSGLGGNVGPLPFTGFDVIAMAAVALAVTGLGLALQRAVSRDPSDRVGS